MMIKHTENLKKLPKKLSDALSQLSQSENPPAVLASGALAETAASARVRVAGGQLSVTDGPFTETKEVVGGFAILAFESQEEAVRSAREYMELYQKYWPEWEGETEIRRIYGPDEITFETGRMELKAEIKRNEK